MDDEVRWNAAEGLVNMDEPDLDTLTQLAQSSEDGKVRRNAAEGLAKIGKPALGILTRLAQSSNDKAVRRCAAEGLVKIGEPALDPLIQMAQFNVDVEVRQYAQNALSGMPLTNQVRSILLQIAFEDPLNDVGAKATLALLTPLIDKVELTEQGSPTRLIT
jgi:HEAT repeat protein